MQQMGRCMVFHNKRAEMLINDCFNRLAYSQLSIFDIDFMNVLSLRCFLDIFNISSCRVGINPAMVCYLTTAFSVKRCLMQYHPDVIASVCSLNLFLSV